MGDLWADRHEFVSSTRRQSQRTEIRYRRRMLDVCDVTLVHGLPAMTIERTIADLVGEIGDLSLVANALGAAARKRALDLQRLRELLAPSAEGLGFLRNDGQSVLDRLFEEAELDAAAVADRVAADPVLGARIAANFLGALDPAVFERLALPPSAKQNVVDALELLAETLHASISSQLEAVNAASTAAVSELLRGGLLDRVGSPAPGDVRRSAPTNPDIQRLEKLPARAAANIDHETAPAFQEGGVGRDLYDVDMRRAYVEAQMPLREAFVVARKWADGGAVTLMVSSTREVDAQPWLESSGVAIGTTSNRHSRFSAHPHGAVIGWCLGLDEVLDLESESSVTGVVVVRAHASHAPWITAHDVERLGGRGIAPVPESSGAIKAMVEGISLLPVINQGLIDSRERSMAVQALSFMRERGHTLDPKGLVVEAIRQGWPGSTPLEFADLARDLNEGKRLRFENRLDIRALERWASA